MKLLFDEDISPRFVAGLADVFRGAVHIRIVGLGRATDAAICSLTLDRDLTIVSKQSGFHQMSFVWSWEPAVCSSSACIDHSTLPALDRPQGRSC